MDFVAEREQVIAALQGLANSQLSPGSSGNVSMRVSNGMLISPTGQSALETQAADLVYLPFDAKIPTGQLRPSSEWHMHQYIYQNRDDAQAIVHCHSRYATSLACQRRAIPAFHYMVAVAGGVDIPCADYAVFGSLALAENVSAALSNRSACLMANHGQIAYAANPQQALELAKEIEELAANYTLSLKTGGPVLLNDEQMQDVIERFKHYGQQ